ncbi:hypothetical protein V8F06_000373 [Rhypophila decipiens]
MPDSFPQFGFLPWELRHAIWTLAVRPPGSGVYFVKDENSRKSRNLRHTWALDDRELYEHASTFEIDSGLWSACRESKAVIHEVYRKRGLHPFIIPSRNKQSNLIQSVTGEPIVSFVKHDTPELDHPKELESWTETPLFTILPRADLGICKIELWPSGCPKLPQSMHPFYSTSPAYGLVVPEYLQEMWKHLRFLALDLPPELWRLYRPSQGKGFPTSPIETLMVEILGMPYPHLYPHLETIFIIDWELKTRPEVEDFARLPIKFTGNGVRFVAYQYVGKAKEAHELPAVEIRGSSQAVKYTSKSGVNGHDIVTSLERGESWEVSQRVRLLRGRREIKLGVLACEKYL